VQNSSGQAYIFSAIQGSSRISRNPNVLYRRHKIPPHSKPEEPSPFPLILFFVTYFNIIVPSTLYFPISFLSSGFPTNTLHAFLFYPKRCPFPAHMNPVHFITLTIFGGKQCSRGSSYDILHPAVPLTIKNFIWVIILLEIGNNQQKNISAVTTLMTYFFNIPSKLQGI
jgi:hypothetical protein